MTRRWYSVVQQTGVSEGGSDVANAVIERQYHSAEDVTHALGHSTTPI
eukprot:COSAG01_NODE_5890_length_3967_cov_83.799121_3_plen_48_part_00